MAVLSLTVLPLVVLPKKKLHVLHHRLFLGDALGCINLDNSGILIVIPPRIISFANIFKCVCEHYLVLIRI
jgi:hypothetical protein